jgi:hypothetical protein
VPYVQNAVSPYFDDDYMREVYGTLMTPSQPNASRMSRAWIEGLARQGYFRGATVGLVRLAGPTLDRIVAEDIRPALDRAGVALADDLVLTNAEGVSAGVLRFRAANISHVLILDDSSLASQVWMAQAESQGYRPRYGLNSANIPDIVESNAAPAQLDGALGVGWYPPFDTGERGDDRRTTPARDECLRIMADHGVALPDRTAVGLALSSCDAFSYFAAMVARAQQWTPRAFVAAAESVGDSWTPAATFASRTAPGRLDGTAAVRDFGFAADCECFRYSGEPYSIG